jgi:hypothetical protein
MPSAASAPSAKNKLKTPKRVNPVARALRSGHLRPRVVKSGKLYTRKGKMPSGA